MYGLLKNDDRESAELIANDINLTDVAFFLIPVILESVRQQGAIALHSLSLAGCSLGASGALCVWAVSLNVICACVVVCVCV